MYGSVGAGRAVSGPRGESSARVCVALPQLFQWQKILVSPGMPRPSWQAK